MNDPRNILSAPDDAMLCYCAGVSVGEVRAAIAAGARSLGEIKAATGACAPPRGGRCKDLSPKRR